MGLEALEGTRPLGCHSVVAAETALVQTLAGFADVAAMARLSAPAGLVEVADTAAPDGIEGIEIADVPRAAADSRPKVLDDKTQSILKSAGESRPSVPNHYSISNSAGHLHPNVPGNRRIPNHAGWKSRILEFETLASHRAAVYTERIRPIQSKSSIHQLNHEPDLKSESLASYLAAVHFERIRSNQSTSSVCRLDCGPVLHRDSSCVD